jgi:hypothetical protein
VQVKDGHKKTKLTNKDTDKGEAKENDDWGDPAAP